MATYTAASQHGYSPFSPSTSHTADDTYIGTAPTQNATGYDPDGLAPAPYGQRSAAARSGYVGDQSGAASASTSLTETYPGTAPVQGIGGFGAAATEPTVEGEWTRNYPRQRTAMTLTEATDAAGAAPASASISATYPGEPGHFNVTGYDPDAVKNGSLIPTSYFRKLTGIVVDTDGEPIEDAKMLIANGNLATAGDVREDGTFTVFVLKNRYVEFTLIGDSGRNNVDYTWYEAVDTSVEPTENNVTLVFDTGRLKGLYGGTGADFGGQLG